MLTYNKMHFFSTSIFPELVQITDVMHLAAQAAVRYAMENPGSYVQSNIAQLVNRYLRDMQACKSTAIRSLGSIQLCVIWVVEHKGAPFSELDQTDQPASVYAATKKAGEEIAHEYI
jgi:UDP-glucuronate 4-epimerase